MTNNPEVLALKDLPFLKKNLKRIDKAILKSLPPKNYSKISKAIHYSVLNGGKRIRPQLVLLMAEALQVDVSPKTIDLMAAAGELIHCYSLIHDDLPSMDDDDFRRGKLSCHKKFDEATAILVGDAFQSLAFEVLSDKETHRNPEVRCILINELSRASGALGMVGGQMLDLDAEKKKLSLKQILMLQKLKTGELFKFCCLAGPILAESTDLKLFTEFAANLGLAFQIRDDLLDIDGDEKKLGKKVNKDSSRGKETLISFYGKEKAKKKSEDLIEESIKLLKHFGKKADKLIDLTNFVILRNM